MAKKQAKHVVNSSKPKRKSKRERRMKFFVYVMVVAMLLSLFTAGLSFF
ncbi:MAG TPA: stressosome-associated protein Prli42 [Pseudogracilibacillus sp.]|nr:stressosome-associated protein Prli42 [Pseudogracilibacillus sp.]